MTKHISDELPRLLTGDATHDVVMEAAEHLRTCPDCQQELVSSVVAHASLTSAHRFAPEVVAPVSHREASPSQPPLTPVTRIHGVLDPSVDSDETETELDDEPAADPLPDQLPDMSSVFDQVRAEAAQAKATPARAGRGRRGLLAVAAAAVVLAGGGLALDHAVDGGNSPSGNSFALNRFGEGHASGKATIAGDTVTLDAASLPNLTRSQRYEVWLTDAARKHMYAIGFLGDGSSATFKVKHRYLDEFSNIEVSKQPAGRTTYSHVSVLRGAYTI